MDHRILIIIDKFKGGPVGINTISTRWAKRPAQSKKCTNHSWCKGIWCAPHVAAKPPKWPINAWAKASQKTRRLVRRTIVCGYNQSLRLYPHKVLLGPCLKSGLFYHTLCFTFYYAPYLVQFSFG